ncbi:MAG: M28 family peptidase [Flammeovirgaceae bacterium]
MKITIHNLWIFLGIISVLVACQSDAQIDPSFVKETITKLASDEMMGRKAGTPGAQKAANYIAEKYKEIGLKPFGTQKGFLQQFNLTKVKPISINARVNKRKIELEHIFFYANAPKIEINDLEEISVVTIEEDADFFQKVLNHTEIAESTLFLVDRAWKTQFQKARKMMMQEKYTTESEENQKLIIWVLTDLTEAQDISFASTSEVSTINVSNVIGVLPGKSKKGEYVIYSGHHDHIGIIAGNAEDSIANGADDDASGIAAVITLAQHFKKVNINERSLIFACFTAEEIGLHGSNYFTTQIDVAKVIAGINIEMIGKVSKFGKKEAFLTGYDRSDLGEILNQNLADSPYKIYPDPYPQYRLFYRADNASLAKKGVPAHTISTSQIDNDKYYHHVDDEVETLDIQNMTEIIMLIAQGTESIVKGSTTPSRIEKVE